MELVSYCSTSSKGTENVVSTKKHDMRKISINHPFLWKAKLCLASFFGFIHLHCFWTTTRHTCQVEVQTRWIFSSTFSMASICTGKSWNANTRYTCKDETKDYEFLFHFGAPFLNYPINSQLSIYNKRKAMNGNDSSTFKDPHSNKGKMKNYR